MTIMTPSSQGDQGGFARWWKELRQPRLKCERLGHVMRARRVNVIYESDPDEKDFSETLYRVSRYVALEATEVTPTCARCGHTEAMRVEDKRWLTGLTTSRDQMHALRRDGRIKV